MGSSFSGPGNPNDQLFAGEADLEISGPPVPPDQLSAEAPEGLLEEEARESGAAAGGE